MTIIQSPFSDNELLQYKFYSEPELVDAALILDTDDIATSKFDVRRDELFRELSNYHTLKKPIYDEYNNEFWDSEGYYMAGRIEDKKIKKIIAMMSKHYGLARSARKIFNTAVEMDELKRAYIMRDAINKKFQSNPYLQDILSNTGKRDIIEYTYRNDDLFGIDQEFKVGRNVLGKLLMEYRDLFLR